MAAISLFWNINMAAMMSFQNALLLTHNRSPQRQNATIESFTYEDDY